MAQPPTTTAPLVVISYHPDDKMWSELLFQRLYSAAAKPRLTAHELNIDPFVGLTERMQSEVQEAKVVVLLISPAYLRSTPSEDNIIIFKPVLRERQHLLGLVVQHVGSADLSKLPNHCLRVNAVPLDEASAERQEEILTGLVGLVDTFLGSGSASPAVGNVGGSQLPLAALARFEWSSEVENTLELARSLARASLITPATVTTSCLLFGLAERGREKVDHFKTPQFLWKALTSRNVDAYVRALTEQFPRNEWFSDAVVFSHGQADLITTNVVEVFELAESFSARTVITYGKRPLGTHHLLAALLMFTPADVASVAHQRLNSLISINALREQFYDFIVESEPDEDHGEWWDILFPTLPRPEQEAVSVEQPSPKADSAFSQPTVAGFMADEWMGRDLLGITRDVNALASLVAAYKVEPPLSIGLFGDWGSGKSHFMRQMRKRVELLSQKARESGKPQNELGYYKNIVQIEFNAWHYIEGNLWASLVDHIFANLRFSEKEPRKYADERRDELMQKLGVKEEIQDRINSKVQECEVELRKLNERKEQAEAELQQASTQLYGFREEVKANLKTLSIPVTFTTEETELLNRLGIKTGPSLTAADVHKNYLELKSGWNAAKAKWQLFRTDKRVVRRYLLSTLLVAISIGGPALLKFGALARLPVIVVSILGAAATLLAAAKPVWEQFHKSLKALEKRDQEVERERQKRITELENRVSALTNEVVAAKLESETVGKEIARLKTDIENTDSSRILAEFIEDRAGASDYRRHLGLLALIRRDFEKLRDLFEQQRKEENDGTEVDDKKKINRIVLYIDDLDRCPPERVVQVLQAIHLLLAFPLFVVVVGVDSRWITRSLRQNYGWLREVDEQLSSGEKKNGAEEQDDHRFERGATPHDYLEKIFQIPFWLRSMNDDACVEFLNGLTKDAVEQVPVAKPDSSFVAIKRPREQAGALGAIDVLEVEEAQEVAAKPEIVESGGSIARSGQTNKELPRLSVTQEEIDLAPRSLTFSPTEIEYMKQLVPLIGRSPRAVKRFLNCYRLIKVGLTPAEFESFATEENQPGYKAAMILLGVITGTPAVSSYVIDHLKTWRLEGVESTVEAWANVFARNPEVRRQPDAERLIRFFETHDFTPTSSSRLLIEEMVNYVSRISRFSFRLNQPDPFRR